MAWYRAGGGGIPSSLKTGMNSVLNKKFGTATTYDPAGWPDDVNLLGKLPEKTVSGAVANITDGADRVPLKELIFSASPVQASGNPSPSNPLPISGHMEMNGVHCGKNLLNPILYDGGAYNPTVDSQITFTESTTQFSHVGNTYSVTFTESWKTYTMLIPVKYGQAYYCNFTLSGTGTNLGTSVYFVDADGKVVASASNNTSNPQTRTFSVNVPSGAKLFCITFTNRGTAETTLTFTEPMIEVGSSASTYVPFSAETKKWSFPPFGKNLLNYDTLVDGYVNTDGTFNTAHTQGEMRSQFIPVEPNTTYYFSIQATGSSYNDWMRIGQYSSANTSSFIKTNSYWSFTTDENAKYIVVSARNLADATQVQLEKSSTATSYEPYQSMFDGSVNALTGEVESDSELFVFDGSEDETWTMYTVNTDQHLFRISNCPRKNGILTAGANQLYSLCNAFSLSTNESTGRTQGKYSGTGTNIDFVNNDCADVSAWKTWLSNNPIQFVCERDTPIETTLDSVDWQTQLGDNNFYNDCGDTEVTYRADIDLALGGN